MAVHSYKKVNIEILPHKTGEISHKNMNFASYLSTNSIKNVFWEQIKINKPLTSIYG
jgi:pterin-4a-carbinolamine dehydratase